MRLVTTLILMAWGGGSAALTDRFAVARTAWADDATATTYQGFIKALLAVGLNLLRRVEASLRPRLLAVAGRHGRRLGFFALAVDGSRFELPRTAGHERVFGTGGKADGAPQMWVTMLWHLGVGLPWDWRIGRAGAGEREHLRRMLDSTPADTLIVADAGFTGYALLRDIVAGGRHFLLRAGKAVELLRGLGDVEQVDRHTVHLWPAHARRGRQRPLVLRLIRLPAAGDRRRKFYLLTSVLDHHRLSDQDASTLYRLRWGVELCYRSLKQTLEKRKLRSAAPATALFEMHGLLLGLTLLGLLSVSAIIAGGGDPLGWSVAAALRAVRQVMHRPRSRVDWRARLSAALKDHYPRARTPRRRWPRKKQAAPPPGRPHIRQARRGEITQYSQLQMA
jgi:hypothetical protein